MSAAEHLTYQGIDFGTGPDADKLRSTYMREGGETPERARIRKELADKKPHVDDAPGIQPTDSEPVTFLKAWPFYPTLTAIHIDPVTGAKVMLPGKKTNVETKAFPPDSDGFVDWVTVEKWIAPRNGKANLYFLVNPTNEPKDSKASATDIGALVALHVDVDVRVGEDQEAGIARIVKTFQDYKLWPCFIVASGGGAQAFWMLERPLMLDGTKAAADDAALYNVALERDLGGDHCHNVDRIMRLPGTLNIPNESKLKKGRKPALAHIVDVGPVCSYAIAEFAKAAADKPDAPKPKENEFKPDDKIVTEPVTFEYLRKAGITDDILDIILTAPLEVTGTDGKTLKGGGIHFKVVMAMRRRGLSTAVIKAAYRLGKLGTAAASATRGFDGYLDKTIAAADEKIGVIVSNDDHMERAEIFVAHVRKNLKSYKGDFVDYKDGRYVEAAPDTIDADERTFLRKCSVAVSDGKGGS